MLYPLTHYIDATTYRSIQGEAADMVSVNYVFVQLNTNDEFYVHSGGKVLYYAVNSNKVAVKFERVNLD